MCHPDGILEEEKVSRETPRESDCDRPSVNNQASLCTRDRKCIMLVLVTGDPEREPYRPPYHLCNLSVIHNSPKI